MLAGISLCTIENRADEITGESDLLQRVQIVPDLWGVGIIGPGLELGVRHSSGVHEGGGISADGGIEDGEEGAPR